MIFEVLGSSSGLPEAGKHLSSVYVNLGDHHLLFDCGEGVALTHIQKKWDPDFLDAVIITHLHPDHVSGIYMLIQSLYILNRTRSLKIFLPERPEEFRKTFDLFYTFPERLSFRMEFCKTADVNAHYPEIQACRNDHLLTYAEFIHKGHYENPMHCYSLKCKEADKSLVYSSDIQTISSIAEFIRNSEICLIDAIHPNAEEFPICLELVKEKILLTHGQQSFLNDFIKGKEKFEYVQENKTYTL